MPLYSFFQPSTTFQNFSFRIDNSSEKSAHVIGRVIISINGQPLSPTWDGPCYIYLNGDERSNQYKLDESGEIFFSTAPGPFTIQKLKCSIGSTESSFNFFPEIPSSVLEAKSLNYIGDLKIDWHLGQTNYDVLAILVDVIAAVTSGYSGGKTSSWSHKSGPIDLSVELNEGTIQSFNNQYPAAKKFGLIKRPIQLINVSKE